MNDITTAALRTLLTLTLSLSIISNIAPTAKAGELIAPAAPAAVQEIPWGITGTAGGTSDDFYGGMELLFPLWFDGDTLLFLYPEVEVADKDRQAYSLGLGLRHYFEEWNAIAGISAFWDITSSTYDNTYNGFGLSAEILTKWVDARLNWYLVGNDQNLIDSQTQNSSFSSSSSSTSFGAPFAQGNQILQPTATTVTTTTTSFSQTFERFEAGMDGLDAEIGVLLPYFTDLTGMELRIFGGYYTYDNPFGDDIKGFKARGELRVTEWLTADIAYYEDEELFGGNVYGGARVHFPLGKLERPVHVGGGYVDTGKGAGYASYGKGGVAKAPVEFAPAPLPDDSIAYRLTENIIRTPRIITSESGYIENLDKRKESTETTKKTSRGQTVVLDDVVFVNNGPATDNGIAAAGKGGPKKKAPKKKAAASETNEVEIAEAATKKKAPKKKNPYQPGTAENPLYTLQAGSQLAQQNYFETNRIWNVFAAPGKYNGAVRVFDAPVNFYGNINANGHMFNEYNAELHGGFRARNVEHFSVSYFDIYGGLPRRDGFDGRDILMTVEEGADGIPHSGGLGEGPLDGLGGYLAGHGGIGIHATNVDHFHAKHNYIDTDFIGILADWGPPGGGNGIEEVGEGIEGIGDGEIFRRRPPAHFHIAYNDIYSPIGIGILNGGRRQVEGAIKNNYIDPQIPINTDFLGNFGDIAAGDEAAEGAIGDIFTLPGLGIGVLGTGISDTYVNIWGNDIHGLVGIAGVSTGRSDVHIWADYNDIYSFIGALGVSLGGSDLTFDMVHNHFEPELFIPGGLIEDIFNIGFFPDLTIPGIGAAFVSLQGSTLNANLWDNYIDQALLGVGVASFGESELNLYAAKNNINALIGIGGLAFQGSDLNVDLRHNYIAGDFPLGEFLLDLFTLPGFAPAMEAFAAPVLEGLGIPEGNPLALAQNFNPPNLPLEGLPVLGGLDLGNLGLGGIGLPNGDEAAEGVPGDPGFDEFFEKIRIPGVGVGLLGFDNAVVDLYMEGNFIDPIVGVGVGAFGNSDLYATLEGNYVQALLPVAAIAGLDADVDIELWNNHLDARLVLPLLGLNIPGSNVTLFGYSAGEIDLHMKHNYLTGGLVNLAGISLDFSEVRIEAEHNEMNGLVNNLFLGFGTSYISADLTDNWMNPDFSLANLFGESGLIPDILGNVEIGDLGFLPPLFPGESIQDLISGIEIPGASVLSLTFGNSEADINLTGNHIDPLVGVFLGAFGNSDNDLVAIDNHIVGGAGIFTLTLDEGNIDTTLTNNEIIGELTLTGLGESLTIPGIGIVNLSFGDSTQTHNWNGNTIWGAVGSLSLTDGDSFQQFNISNNLFETQFLGAAFVALNGPSDVPELAIDATLTNNKIWAPGGDIFGQWIDGGIGLLNIAGGDAISQINGSNNHIHAGSLGAVNWSFSNGTARLFERNGIIHSDGFDLFELLGGNPGSPFPTQLGLSAGVWNQAFDFGNASTLVENSDVYVGPGNYNALNSAFVNLSSGSSGTASLVAANNEINAPWGYGIFSQANGEFGSSANVEARGNWIQSYSNGIWLRSVNADSQTVMDLSNNMITSHTQSGIKLDAEAPGNNRGVINGDEAPETIAGLAEILGVITGNYIHAANDGLQAVSGSNPDHNAALIRIGSLTNNTIHAGDDGFDFKSQGGIDGGDIEVNGMPLLPVNNDVWAGDNLIETTDPGNNDVSGPLTVNNVLYNLPITVPVFFPWVW
ncbi:MAG: inverse autotransporter beta domain-containing protein [Verrucomicrobiota bacterium]